MYNLRYFSESRVFECNKNIYNSLYSINCLEVDNRQLEVFLKIGYVPSNLTIFKNVNLVDNGNRQLKDIFLDLPEYEHNIDTLKNITLESIEDRYKRNTSHIVPLSGGMDSRIVLAALLEFTEARNIHTYTFGMPGSYDYEIPNSIARKLGTKHTNFNAEDTSYSIDGLVRAAVASDGNTEVFHPLVLNRVADHYDSGATYWSGLGGDFVGGGLGSNKMKGKNPLQHLINYEKRGIHFLDGVVNDESLYEYINISDKMSGVVPTNEAYFWENHHQRYTRHHIIRNDMSIEAPLVDTRLMKFFFTLDENERQNKKFFNESFSSIFSDLFRFPTKDYGYKYSKYPLLKPLRKAKFYSKAMGWRIAPNLFTHPNAAYIDMQHAINERSDVRSCIDELLADLAKRDLVDNKRMFSFLSDHRNGHRNYTKDIINLASLEVILKAANL